MITLTVKMFLHAQFELPLAYLCTDFICLVIDQGPGSTGHLTPVSVLPLLRELQRTTRSTQPPLLMTGQCKHPQPSLSGHVATVVISLFLIAVKKIDRKVL